MARYLNHKYKLTLEVPAPPQPEQTVTKGTGVDVVITELQIKGQIKSTKDSSTGTNLKIDIYNLSDKSVDTISQEDVVVKLEVGYTDQPLKLLFTGNLLQIQTVNNGKDRITSILATENLSNIREAQTGTSWDHDISVEDVFKQIIVDDLKLALGNIHNGTLGSGEGIKKVLKKYSATGSSKSVLDDLAKGNELVWNVTNGQVNVYPKGSSKSFEGEVIPLYTTATGLISSPNKAIINSDKVKGSKEKKNGKSFQVILNPALSVGGTIKIESRNFNEEVVIKDLSHVFDYWKGKWQSNIISEGNTT